MKKEISRRTLLLGLVSTGSMAMAADWMALLGRQNISKTGQSHFPYPSEEGGSAPYITQVRIEQEGWVLQVTGYWPKSHFSDFHLEENGEFAVTLSIKSQGYTSGPNWAVADCHLRTVRATKALRVSLPGPPMDLTSLDEKELGNGLRTVRLALSEPVHRNEQVVSALFRQGWRKSMPTMQNLQVMNLSLFSPEIPTMQWVVPTLMRATRQSDVRLDLLVASGWAMGRSAVAAVKFTATDGSQTNVSWQLQATHSFGWGDALRCWGVSARSLCEGLQPGPITVHAEIYPWIGLMRSTGNGHSTQVRDALICRAERPVHVLWDPQGLHMPEAHVYVHPAKGSSNPASVTVGQSLQAAKAGVAAATPSVAAQAIRLAERHIRAANGWPPSTAAGDNAIITLAPGVHGFGTQNVSVGATITQGRMILQGDPSDVAPREHCILDGLENPNWRYGRMLIRNLTLRIGNGGLPFRSAVNHLHNVMVTALPGMVSSNRACFLRTEGYLYNTITASSWINTAVPMRGTNMNFGFIRGCIAGVALGAPVLVGNEKHQASNNIQLFGVVDVKDPAAAHDQIMWGNRIHAARGTVLSFPIASAREGALALPALVRFRLVNNLFEMASPRGENFDGLGKQLSTQPFGQLGEGGYVSAMYCLIEGNTFVGQRLNWGYNTPPTNSPGRQNRHMGNFVRNNYFDRAATKHDSFASPDFGRRPGFTQSWSILYGVGYSSNVFGQRWSNPGNFSYEYGGVGALTSPYPGHQQANMWTKFRSDKSQFGLGPDQQGFGDYAPAPGSPLRDMAMSACIDEDAFGVPRKQRFSAGCAESSDNYWW